MRELVGSATELGVGTHPIGRDRRAVRTLRTYLAANSALKTGVRRANMFKKNWSVGLGAVTDQSHGGPFMIGFRISNPVEQLCSTRIFCYICKNRDV